jgi:bifunctional UDP-N-acetylglucosamine pyrophosphorylase/glucosamine-1-phosphate N-acetyltransferase
VDGLHAAASVVVIGHGAEEVRAALSARPALQFAVQSPQLGTGHALMQAVPALAGKSGTVPARLWLTCRLLQANTLSRLIEHHRTHKGGGNRPHDGATRAVRLRADRARIRKGQIARIVEERDRLRR